jgi:stress-induced morphogen
MIEPEQVQKLLLDAFPGADVELKDLTGSKDHFQARVVSDRFAGRTLVEQHQLVYQALGKAMDGPIHALALKTYTPEAWARVSGGH